ncbi:hypothetical protein ACQCVK_15005 [Rossellomorea vietnamensis]|uniref:hypothetical protein n=1 Tax=Rossellomorea vietnamensis TaxID=218284 RepID=UPI003CEEC0FD
METIDLEKMMKIALFAAAVYNEDGSQSNSIQYSIYKPAIVLWIYRYIFGQ